ncbi:MAG: hypothetical protein SFX19_02590 [Alphaproteobacteria bacterium]|nr:hypothetical protein [Alphaproteobacteria bacterium]
MTIAVGSKVMHKNKSASFGKGTVMHINYDAQPASVLVEWDAHSRKVGDSKYSDRQTHVKITSLAPTSLRVFSGAAASKHPFRGWLTFIIAVLKNIFNFKDITLKK